MLLDIAVDVLNNLIEQKTLQGQPFTADPCTIWGKLN